MCALKHNPLRIANMVVQCPVDCWIILALDADHAAILKELSQKMTQHHIE